MHIYTPKQRKQTNLYYLYLLIGVIALLAASLWLYCKATGLEQVSLVQPAMAQEVSYDFDPCSLRDVQCDGEKQPKTVYATITTYQAVPGQTDETPCQGAKAGIDFCNPPYPIVAVNGLPFGTKVVIRGTTYTVSDRMNSRYGSNHFDVLTDGNNFSLTNEPVTILQ